MKKREVLSRRVVFALCALFVCSALSAAPGDAVAAGKADRGARVEGPNPSGHTDTGASEARCGKNKLIRRGTFRGAYTGGDCGDFCYANFKLPSGKEVAIGCDEAEAERRYGGAKRGKMGVVHYEVREWWIPEGGFCSHSPVCIAPPKPRAKPRKSGR